LRGKNRSFAILGSVYPFAQSSTDVGDPRRIHEEEIHMSKTDNKAVVVRWFTEWQC